MNGAGRGVFYEGHGWCTRTEKPHGVLRVRLGKEGCLSPTRRNRFGTKGRTTFQAPEGVRQIIRKLSENLMRQTSIGLGRVLRAQERI